MRTCLLVASIAAFAALAGCQKVGTDLACGGESFKVDFGDKSAKVTLDGKSTTVLPLLERPVAAGTAQVYTNGIMTLTRMEAAGASPVIKFARGRMAFQDCRMAAN